MSCFDARSEVKHEWLCGSKVANIVEDGSSENQVAYWPTDWLVEKLKARLVVLGVLERHADAEYH